MAYTLSPAALAARRRGAATTAAKHKIGPQVSMKMPPRIMAIIDKECQAGEARWKALERLLTKAK